MEIDPNSRPPDTQQFICPLDFALIGYIGYILATSSETKAPSPIANTELIVHQAIAKLGLANVSPIASP